MEKIVPLHKLGYDSLHRREATKIADFKEFNSFDMRDCRIEYEANVSASQIWYLLPRKSVNLDNVGIVMPFLNIINKTVYSKRADGLIYYNLLDYVVSD